MGCMYVISVLVPLSISHNVFKRLLSVYRINPLPPYKVILYSTINLIPILYRTLEILQCNRTQHTLNQDKPIGIA
ncbi:hypothetical protein F4801DRAFT_539678 [Xylaria longipes]|nr:hypothetical protein F4801DRAFT_539678 [Xylaria longipes]